MIILVNKAPCNIKLGEYLIKASSTIELADEEAIRLLETYPNQLERKIKTKKGKKNDNSNNT